MEYLTFGHALERCRSHFLQEAKSCRRALVLGDGDGRFVTALLDAVPGLQVDAVDVSWAMLEELRRRATAASDRLRIHHMDATGDTLPTGPFDLVCTHFFLDCLSTEQVGKLAEAVRERMPEGVWMVSEFAVPESAVRLPAASLVRLLYLGFGMLTGLRTRRLPDYAAAMQEKGFVRIVSRPWIFGLLRSELWRVPSQEELALPAGARIQGR